MPLDHPSFTPALVAVAEYSSARQDSFSQEQLSILQEIHRRLERLSVQGAALMEINNQLLAAKGFAVLFDEASDTVVLRMGDAEHRVQMKRANPDVPITVHRATAVSAYSAEDNQATATEESLRFELEEKLEGYYYSAHRLLKLFGRIKDLRRIKCSAVTRVRNNLIEHPGDGSLYSFAVSSNGPIVKPMRRGTLSFTDPGLVANAQALVDAIVFGVSRAAP